MATQLDRFKKNTIGSAKKDSNYNDKLLPSADLERYEGINAIVESWKNILVTPERTSDHDPEYGSKLPQFIFDPSDPETREKIIDEVKYKLMLYDNRATIGRISVTQHRNKKGYTLDILVRYKGEEEHLSQPIDESLLK